MSHFTEKEIEYMTGQRLGRLATVANDGSPHVVPVGFRVDAQGQAVEVGGHGLSGSKKWRDLQANPRIAPCDRRPGERESLDATRNRNPRAS
jgi:PPOX class F420-dependent enzyme/OxyR family protein